MATTPATHPLATATASAHPWDDCVLSSQSEAESLDQRVAALAALVEPSAEAQAELVSLARAISAAEGRERSGGRGSAASWAWRQVSIGQIRAVAERLGLDPESLDIR